MNPQPLFPTPPIKSYSVPTAQPILVTLGNRLIEIGVEQLVCLEGYGNYTYLYTTDGKRHLSSKTLKWFYTMLDGNMFVRVHKSFIISWDSLLDICEYDRAVRLKNGREIAISRRRLREVRILASIKGH